jgi:hypothetical protein
MYTEVVLLDNSTTNNNHILLLRSLRILAENKEHKKTMFEFGIIPSLIELGEVYVCFFLFSYIICLFINVLLHQ